MLAFTKGSQVSLLRLNCEGAFTRARNQRKDKAETRRWGSQSSEHWQRLLVARWCCTGFKQLQCQLPLAMPRTLLLVQMRVTIVPQWSYGIVTEVAHHLYPCCTSIPAGPLQRSERKVTVAPNCHFSYLQATVQQIW